MRGAQPWKTNRARVLRSTRVSAEHAMWLRLRDRRMAGYKFLRQFPIGAYFADFACREARLVIEIDGGTHGEDHEVTADQRRAAEIERLGYKLVRVSNRDVYDNIEGVLEGILAELLKR